MRSPLLHGGLFAVVFSSPASAQATSTTSSGTTCTATAYSQITSAVASCTNIILENISVPASSTLLLTKLKAGSTVTFAGETTFGTTADAGFNPIEISGTNITITGEPGSIIDGNGQSYWDGLGSNGGTTKPDHFIVLSKLTNSLISNLYIQNWPTHCFSITSSTNLTLTSLTLNNSAGDAPNSISGGLPAAHNTDGFDLASSTNILLENSTVWNQDDCVAVTSGNNVTVTGMSCVGGHGLSIGSIGGKSNNVVTNITFSNSTVTNSENGCRIKSNSGTTGTIANITYENILLSGISTYGIDVQQDYLNGGPTGTPTNGVSISNLLLSNVTGTATASGTDYYILCGSGSCANFVFEGVDVSGGGKESSCNFPGTGCP